MEDITAEEQAIYLIEKFEKVCKKNRSRSTKLPLQLAQLHASLMLEDAKLTYDESLEGGPYENTYHCSWWKEVQKHLEDLEKS